MIGRSRTYRPSLWARIFLSESWKLVLSASSSDRIRLQLGADDDIHCLDVAEVSSTKALLWLTVEIRSKGRVDSLSGLTATSAQPLQHDLLALVTPTPAKLFTLNKH